MWYFTSITLPTWPTRMSYFLSTLALPTRTPLSSYSTTHESILSYHAVESYLISTVLTIVSTHFLSYSHQCPKSFPFASHKFFWKTFAVPSVAILLASFFSKFPSSTSSFLPTYSRIMIIWIWQEWGDFQTCCGWFWWEKSDFLHRIR